MKVNPKKKILLYRITAIILILLTSILQGQKIVYSYTQDTENPLYDVFYMYFNNEKDSAEKLIKYLFENPKLKNLACINYGFILEDERKFKLAEKYYRKALNEGEKTAFIYLHNFYKKYYPIKSLRLLQAAPVSKSDYWIDYAKAVYYLKYNKSKVAIKYLKQAIKKGFNSTALLEKDPIFDSLRNTKRFKSLLHRARNNSFKKKSLSKKLQLMEYLFKQDKPYGMNRELQIVAYLLKTGRDKKARETLTSLIKSRVPFRDKNIALFYLARLEAKDGNNSAARKYLNRFTEHLSSDEQDNTGYKKLVGNLYEDIIRNDRYLKSLM